MKRIQLLLVGVVLAACALLVACLPFESSEIPTDFSTGSGTLGVVEMNDLPAGYDRSDVEDPVAAARVFCRPVAMRTVDPFQLTEEDRGFWHLHTFFGNADALTADPNEPHSSMIADGNSTCDGGTANRSWYWVPTMMFPDPGQTQATFEDPLHIVTSFHHLDGHPTYQYDPDGRSNAANGLNVYYKSGYRGVTAADVDQWFPPGLAMIAGNPSADADGENPNVWYGCAALNNTGPINPPPYGGSWSIPDCAVGTMVVMVIEFPQCWDGVHLGHESTLAVPYRSHMAYGTGNWSIGCPSTHPVALPQITELVHLVVTEDNAPSSEWHLSSDMYAQADLTLPGGYSGHADFLSGWNETIGQRIIDYCYRGATNGAGWDCHGPLLGPNPTTGQLEVLADNQ